MLLRQPLPTVTSRNGRLQISPVEFAGQQEELMRRGKPQDPCGYCGCTRGEHHPKPTFSYAKSGGSSGKSVELNVLAPTSCDCHFCICACIAFAEPYEGQPHMRCLYAHE